MTRASKKETPPSVPVPFLKRVSFTLIATLHALSALLFFTNLTRNPYYTQIALLYVFVALIGITWAIQAWREGAIRLPRLAFEWPMLCFLSVAFVSSVWSWATHEMLRPGILYESLRVWMFTLVNSVMAVYLPCLFTKPIGEEPVKISIWSDILLALCWGGLWFGFHSNKDPDPAALIWDSYGGIVWGLGCLYAVLRTRRGEAIEFFHVIFAVAFAAGLYGLMQYSGRDIIWSSLIMPYGGRPVSTFGNPNFLSSYLMMVCPVALAFGLQSARANRWGYLLISFVCALSVLCTLTRSSYVGLLVALIVTLFLMYPVSKATVAKTLGVGAAAAALFATLVLLFPKTPVSALQSPLLRFTEVFDAMRSGQAYGPWHQRILIWSSSWDMLQQNVLFGKGWGCFELFYPFFQGKYLYAPVLSMFRTHANNAHNVLMELWAQVGMVGAGMAIWMFVTIVVSGFKIVGKESAGLGRAVSAALLGAITGMVADNFFGNVSIFFATPAFLFWWNVGALSNESNKRDFTLKPLSSFGRPLLVLFTAFCLFTIVYFYKRWKQEIFYFQGFREAKMGDVSKSVKSLEKAYEWFPGEVNSNYEMGNSYARYARMMAERGLPEEAKKYEQKAIDGFMAALHANPGYDEIYFNLGVTQASTGQQEEGMRNLEISLYINPLLREAYGALANLYLQMGKPAEAANVYERGVDVFPRDKDLWNNLGYSYSQLKDHRKSFESYKRAIMIDPGFNQGWQNLALAAQALGEKKDPILQVPDIIRQMEGHLSRRDYAAALPSAQRAVEILPESADAHLSLANILFYLNQLDRSENEFKRAIELRPGFVIAHTNLGRLYQSKEQIDLARKKFQDALAVDPNDKEAQSALNSLK